MPTKEAIDRRDGAPVERKEIVTKEGTVTYGRIMHEGTDRGAPVLFLPGYGEGIDTMTPISSSISASGPDGGTRAVLTIEHSRTEFTFEQLSVDDLKERYKDASPKAFRCNRNTLRRAHEAILVLEKEGTQANLVGHSYGGMTAVCMALLRPDLVASITLLNSGGLVGKHSQFTLTRRFIWNWLTEADYHKWSKIGPIVKDTFKYIFAKFGRGWRENFDVATSDMVPALKELAGKGIKINVVYDELDRVFPSRLVERITVKALKNTNVVKIVKTGKENKFLHYGPVVNASKYGKFVAGLLAERGQ